MRIEGFNWCSVHSHTSYSRQRTMETCITWEFVTHNLFSSHQVQPINILSSSKKNLWLPWKPLLDILVDFGMQWYPDTHNISLPSSLPPSLSKTVTHLVTHSYILPTLVYLLPHLLTHCLIQLIKLLVRLHTNTLIRLLIYLSNKEEP